MMPRNKREGLRYGLLMAAGIILFPCTINKLAVNGWSWWNVFQILIQYPLKILFVMAVSDYAALPLQRRFAARIAGNRTVEIHASCFMLYLP